MEGVDVVDREVAQDADAGPVLAGEDLCVLGGGGPSCLVLDLGREGAGSAVEERTPEGRGQ
jgi:hypothetical protein